jgi:hypothetical protein
MGSSNAIDNASAQSDAVTIGNIQSSTTDGITSDNHDVIRSESPPSSSGEASRSRQRFGDGLLNALNTNNDPCSASAPASSGLVQLRMPAPLTPQERLRGLDNFHTWSSRVLNRLRQHSLDDVALGVVNH